MKKFIHIDAKSVDEAASLLRRYNGKAALIAGGTDLLGKMKDKILPDYPEAVINIKTIPGLDFIKEESGTLKIGALTRLEDIANGFTRTSIKPYSTEPITKIQVKEKYTALSEAAERTASPHIREMGTVGGNICQDIRCWFYRNPNNRFPCLRKGGGRCYALNGDNRYHSIFGGSVEEGCIAVHPSDVAPALIAMDARIKTSKRTLKAEKFFQVEVTQTTVLDSDEIVTEIQVPTPASDTQSTFLKFTLRKSIDFPIVNCAAMVKRTNGRVNAARICLNAVYVIPYRASKAEDAILGKEINEKNAEGAGNAAISDAKPLSYNKYMVPISKTLIKRSILGCA